MTTINADLERQAFEAGYVAGVEDCVGAHTNLAGHLRHITLVCGLTRPCRQPTRSLLWECGRERRGRRGWDDHDVLLSAAEPPERLVSGRQPVAGL